MGIEWPLISIKFMLYTVGMYMYIVQSSAFFVSMHSFLHVHFDSNISLQLILKIVLCQHESKAL